MEPTKRRGKTMKGQRQNAQIGLMEAIAKADEVISSAMPKDREKGLECIESYYIWYRLFVPGVFDFEDTEPGRLQGEYLVIGADQERLYLWNPYTDRVYAVRESEDFSVRTVYIWVDGQIEGVKVKSETYKRYGKAEFIPFVWVHVLRDIFAGRDTHIGLQYRLSKVSVDIYRMLSLSSKYRKGKYRVNEKERVESMFEGFFWRGEQDLALGKVFEPLSRAFDAEYMLLGVDLNGNTVRMLFGEIVPKEYPPREYLPSKFIFETDRIFVVRTGMVWFEEVDFWHFLSYQYRPVIMVYDRVWGAIFLEVSFPPARFWRTLIHSYDDEGNPQHVSWYVPRRYWQAVLECVQVE
jgi:hypothetical protein